MQLWHTDCHRGTEMDAHAEQSDVPVFALPPADDHRSAARLACAFDGGGDHVPIRVASGRDRYPTIRPPMVTAMASGSAELPGSGRRQATVSIRTPP